jgi:hypothetical protein
MTINWLDWFGYAASVVILVSLTMSSIVKLRWINLAGGVMFSAFGFLIGSIPTGALNLGIAIIDIYYLWRIYTAKDHLAIVEADLGSGYFNHFWDLNRSDIESIFGDVRLTGSERAFYFLRNNNTAGLLIGHESEPGVFCIDIDYVSRPYRDLKIGQHFFVESRISAVLPKMDRLRTTAESGIHERYLKVLGFSSTASPGVYEKTLKGLPER